MIDENLENLSCKSKEYYKEIISIEVRPIKESLQEKRLVARKGDKILKKRLFGKPHVETIQEDLYRYDGRKVNAKTLAYNLGLNFDPEKNMFFESGRVRVRRKGKTDDDFYFYTNDEVRCFVSDLKEKCKKCGNELL